MISYKDKRIGSLLQKEISAIILKELRDPRIQGLITITRVRLPYIKMAIVYVSILGELLQKHKIMKGLRNGKGYIKKRLGENLKLKYIPDIQFKEEDELGWDFPGSKDG